MTNRYQCLIVAAASLIFGAGFSASASGLAPGRAYEMVSPVYKAGYGASAIVGVTPNGETLAYDSQGGFAGEATNNALFNYYVARRGESGWITIAQAVPAQILPYSLVDDFSTSLDLSLAEGKLGPSEGWAFYEGQEYEFLKHDTHGDQAGYFEPLGQIVKTLKHVQAFSVSYQGANVDFSQVVFRSNAVILKEATNTHSAVYALEPLQLIDLNNKGKVINPACGAELGVFTGRRSAYNAISADGREIMFTVAAGGSNCEEDEQLFMRLGGMRTIELSRPVGSSCTEVPCAGSSTRRSAEFEGANEAGNRVFFSTDARLVPSDQDTTRDLYMAVVGCPGSEGEACPATQRVVTSLVQVSRSADAAEVQNVVAVAPDGSHVYFVAEGALTSEGNSAGQLPAKGADNLYVYDIDSDRTEFIADLCTGPEESGQIQDTSCPTSLSSGQNGHNDLGLWAESDREAQVNDCREATTACEPGRFLLFDTYAQLESEDADGAKDVYRYDALTGRLDRVSIGEDGAHANGNDSAFDATIAISRERFKVAEQQNLNSRAISQDGSHAIFASSEPLSNAASNGLTNTYEWRQEGSGGDVSLVSTGVADQPVGQAVISASGRDVFFTTTQGLVPEDTDGQGDIYDARLGGGFAQPPLPAEPCAGDACQGPLTNPAPILVPGSAMQAPGKDVPAPSNAKKRTKIKSRPVAKHRRRRQRGRKNRSSKKATV